MLDLHQIPVHEIRGIGQQKAKELLNIGIRSVGEFIEYFPYRYEDYRLRDLTEVQDGDKITVQGKLVSDVVVQRYGYKKSRMSCKVMIDGFLVTAVWFNRQFLQDQLRAGQEIVLTGKWDHRRLHITVSEHELAGKSSSKTGTLQPIYSVAGSISQKWLRKQIGLALQQYGMMIEEILPREILDKYHFMPRRQAIQHIHDPHHFEDGQAARQRMIYEEFFLFQLKLHAVHAIQRSKADGVAHEIEREAVRKFVRSLPFRLTDSQKKVIAEIVADLQHPFCMNRLLQGDVGSGKTVVAAVSMYGVVNAGSQCALMVPTEILAEQHRRSLEQLFTPYGIQVGLLTGSLTERQRRDTLASLQMGMIDIVVGTHALIQEGVTFRKLGLVVIDEQHRFGVQQRSILRRKGVNPDVLTMTATPIPRTLTITAFGDMDVSTLRELPSGRKPIQTYWVRHNKLEQVLAFIAKEVQSGRQAYVICPLIEESEKLDVQNALDVHAALQQHFSGYRVSLLHGRMTNAEKEQTMSDFAEHRAHILVSTTVIEVGVDVPNSTLMVVYDAERFGLSQLHQLRGRVGRGEHQSYCILISDAKNEVAAERMRIMTETNDGFEIARRDMELRGPGDVFGTKQSGLPEFRIADMISDFSILEKARDDASELVAKSDFWTSNLYIPLRHYLQREQVFDGEVWD